VGLRKIISPRKAKIDSIQIKKLILERMLKFIFFLKMNIIYKQKSCHQRWLSPPITLSDDSLVSALVDSLLLTRTKFVMPIVANKFRRELFSL